MPGTTEFFAAALKSVVAIIRVENPKWGRDQVHEAVKLARLGRGTYAHAWRKLMKSWSKRLCMRKQLFHDKVCGRCIALKEIEQLDRFQGMVIHTHKIEQLKPGRQLDAN